jgi:hypothetical protein
MTGASEFPLVETAMLWSIASIHDGPVYVRFTLDSDRIADILGGQLRAKAAVSRCSKKTPQASMHQQDRPLDATEGIFGTAAENELA